MTALVAMITGGADDDDDTSTTVYSVGNNNTYLICEPIPYINGVLQGDGTILTTLLTSNNGSDVMKEYLVGNNIDSTQETILYASEPTEDTVISLHNNSTYENIDATTINDERTIFTFDIEPTQQYYNTSYIIYGNGELSVTGALPTIYIYKAVMPSDNHVAYVNTTTYNLLEDPSKRTYQKYLDESSGRTINLNLNSVTFVSKSSDSDNGYYYFTGDLTIDTAYSIDVWLTINFRNEYEYNDSTIAGVYIKILAGETTVSFTNVACYKAIPSSEYIYIAEYGSYPAYTISMYGTYIVLATSNSTNNTTYSYGDVTISTSSLLANGQFVVG